MALLFALAVLLQFGQPSSVTIRGYSGDAMEPFLTRDGRYLLFNNSNAVPSQTDLHWAERIDDLTFEYRGRLEGANSPDLDAVASVDSSAQIFFITTRSYAQNLITIYRGRFEQGVVRDAVPLSGLSAGIVGRINFDVEVSADGSTLYFADGLFTGGPVPAAADLVIAIRQKDGSFRRTESDELAAVNTSALEYAASLSSNRLELYFTRLTPGGEPAIYRSTRGTTSSAWETPRRIDAISGFAEAPTVSPDGRALYYHALRKGRFVIERISRPPLPRRRAVTPMR
ncbi:MAG TPA: hypothetical protein VFT12_07185 [Thermoanaerobaculia bacterium]|nr:hypothetical protein [Thermoanaerobaculia bacterium]